MPWQQFAEEILVPLNDALRADERFTEVSWIDPERIMETGGVDSPADPRLPIG
jgi:hypothetical protein